MRIPNGFADRPALDQRPRARKQIIMIGNDNTRLSYEEAKVLLDKTLGSKRWRLHSLVPYQKDLVTCFAINRAETYLQLSERADPPSYTAEVCGDDWNNKLDGLTAYLEDAKDRPDFFIPLSEIQTKAKKIAVGIGERVLVAGVDYQLNLSQSRMELFNPDLVLGQVLTLSLAIRHGILAESQEIPDGPSAWG